LEFEATMGSTRFRRRARSPRRGGRKYPQSHRPGLYCAFERSDTQERQPLASLRDRFYDGASVPQDYAEAVKRFRRSAEQGAAIGQYNLGLMYAEGIGVPKDTVEAVKWMMKAAEQAYLKR
jgi:TPR repeat protein